MSCPNKGKGVCCASCNRECSTLRGPRDVVNICASVHAELVRDGVPEHLAELCAWLAEPMFELEYPDVTADQLIVDTNCQGYFSPKDGYDYDIWVGAGCSSAHSTSAWKLHLEFSSDTFNLTWCNISEWAEDDDRWRGVDLIYRDDDPSRYPPATYLQIRDRIRDSFMSLQTVSDLVDLEDECDAD